MTACNVCGSERAACRAAYDTHMREWEQAMTTPASRAAWLDALVVVVPFLAPFALVVFLLGFMWWLP